MILAIDGPAASGKGTLARALAAHYGLPHLDTGLLYRGVAAALLAAGLDLDDAAAAEHAARGLDPDRLSDAALRGADMGEAASRVAAMPGVRAALVATQRGFAARRGGAVLDGRDIGAVICPEADVKLFVTATPEERALRRHRELRERGEDIAFEAVLADIRRRDARDAGRNASPLRRAEDAALLDTTKMDKHAAFKAAVTLVEAALSRSKSS